MARCGARGAAGSAPSGAARAGTTTIPYSPSARRPDRWRARRTERASTSCTSELFPDPLTPVTQVERTQGDPGVDVLEVVDGGAADLDPTGAVREPAAIDVLSERRGFALEVPRRDRSRGGGEPTGRRGGHDRAAVGAGPRPEVDDPVGRADHRLVVLDDQHAVAHLLEPTQARDQPLRCRADAARPSARPGCSRPPPVPSRAVPPAAPAGARRPRACRSPGPATGSRARHPPGSAAGRRSRRAEAP